MESELLLSVMSGLAQSESESISENNKWGLRYRFEEGTYKAGSAPFGYSVKDGVYSIKEDDAQWVLFIFDCGMKGLSSHQIAKLLTEKKIPTKKGGLWTSTNVCAILKNEKYIGDCLFQKTFMDSELKRHRNKGDVDQFYARDHHDAIISRDVFDAVQLSMEQRKKEKGINSDKGNTRYSFTGKIICGECGAMFVRHMNNTGTVNYAAWVCREHLHQKEKCSMKFVKESVLMGAFVTMMNKLIFSNEIILKRLLVDIRRHNNRGGKTRIAEIDSAISKMTEHRQSLSVLAASGYLDTAVFTQENNSIIIEIEKLKKEKSRLLTALMRRDTELRLWRNLSVLPQEMRCFPVSMRHPLKVL